MSNEVLKTKGFGNVDSGSAAHGTAIGIVAEQEFEAARLMLGLEEYPDYGDWLDSRFGMQMGLAMAGVDAPMTQVGLQGLLDWCARAQITPNEEALDALAAMVLNARNSPFPAALAESSDVGPSPGSSGPLVGTFEVWKRAAFCGDAASATAEPGLRFDGLPIGLNDFLAWCDCVQERPSDGSLERYAQLLVEHFISA